MLVLPLMRLVDPEVQSQADAYFAEIDLRAELRGEHQIFFGSTPRAVIANCNLNGRQPS